MDRSLISSAKTWGRLIDSRSFGVIINGGQLRSPATAHSNLGLNKAKCLAYSL